MRKILVIEDNTSIRTQIITILKLEGFQAFEAKNGLEGVKLTKEILPELIICDILMPELSGYQVLEEIRKNQELAIIPFIFLTAKIETEDVRKGMLSGADDYLTKPFSREELISSIKMRLEKYDLNRKKLETLSKNVIYALPHELNTPLSIIKGYIEFLQDDLEKIEHKNIVDKIMDSTNRIEKLVENYIVYAQIETIKNTTNRLKLLQEQVTTNSDLIIIERAKTISQKYNRINDLILDIINENIEVVPENLTKIIEEVTENAFKFSNLDDSVKISTDINDNYYIIEVFDNGRGMSLENIANIGAYMQFERELYEQQGIGLGLIIAKKLTELHNGVFIIESKENDYTKVTIKLKRKNVI